MSLDYHLKIQGDLMADSGKADFSLQKAAQVRLDNLGLLKNHSCFINNPKRIKLLEQRLELQRSIGRLEGIQKSSALEKDLAEMDKLSPTRINLEESVRVASPTRINLFLCL